MTSERWQQIESLYHTAHALPAGERAAFLAGACGQDAGLRREVESLLGEHVSTDGFAAGPAGPNGPLRLFNLSPGASAGSTLGVYRVETLVGAGGMGEVYRAVDTKLGREVAIKILPGLFANDPDRLARFEREARMLATLNHPNICAIYGLEEADGVRFLVLEFVDGKTLAELLAHGSRLPVDEAIRLAQQIADALDAAHERGIVHRDLKPANIKITSDGQVKVLDFGLAKSSPGDADLTAGTPIDDTRQGMILGTAAYMSPEQARGKTVDKRTDIWAFGCVLYEMLTGRVTFAGDTAADVVGKILEREPEWSALPPATPNAVRWLLRRCLTKDLKQRLRDIGNVRAEIDGRDAALPGASEGAVAPLPTARKRTAWLPWVALAVAVVGFATWETQRAPSIPENPLANAAFSKFTNWEGSEGAAEISPDGKFVAFLADKDGQFDIWWSQVGTGRWINFTKGGPARDGLRSSSFLRYFGFSGDGADIWYGPPGNASTPKVLVPLTSGSPRAFLGQKATAPSWSPDGTRLVYFMNGEGDPLFVADRTAKDAHPIPVSPAPGQKSIFDDGLHNHNPVWSVDSEWIYFVHSVDPTIESNIWRVRPSGGIPEQLTTQHAAINFLAPVDVRTLLYVARQEDGAGPWLWTFDVVSKVARRVNSGLEQYISVSASHDGRRVVATVANPSANLWRVPLLTHGPALDRDVEAYPAPTARALAPRFSKTSLFYLSAQPARGDGLWRLQNGQALEIGKGVYTALSEPVAVSRDGEHLAVVVTQNGKRHLVVMLADGTNARTLAPSFDIQGAAGQAEADWSPDGSALVAGGSGAQGPGLYRIPVDGSAPTPIITGSATNPIWSPTDDNLILYSGPLIGGQVQLLGVTPDGTTVPLPDVHLGAGGYRFTPDGTGVVYRQRNQSLDFWLLDFGTKQTRQITRLGDHGYLTSFDVTPDGKAIVFDRSRENSDVVLIDVPK